MPPDPAPAAGGGLGERLLTMPAALRAPRPRLSSTCSTGSSARKAPRCPGWPPRFRPDGGAFGRARCLGRIRRGRTRGIGRGLAQPGFQLADALLQGAFATRRAAFSARRRGVLQAERRQLLQQRSWVRSRQSSPQGSGASGSSRLDHAAVVARRGAWGKPAAAASAGGPERLRLVHRRAAPLAALLLGTTLLLSPRVASAQDARDFRIQNQSGSTIVELYVSPVSDPNWGSNILQGVIAPGQAARVVFPSGDRFFTCNYDVEVITNDRQTRAATNLDLCSGEFLFYPGMFDRTASPGSPLDQWPSRRPRPSSRR